MWYGLRHSKGGVAYFPVSLIKRNVASVSVSPIKVYSLLLLKANTFFPQIEVNRLHNSEQHFVLHCNSSKSTHIKSLTTLQVHPLS